MRQLWHLSFPNLPFGFEIFTGPSVASGVDTGPSLGAAVTQATPERLRPSTLLDGVFFPQGRLRFAHRVHFSSSFSK